MESTRPFLPEVSPPIVKIRGVTKKNLGSFTMTSLNPLKVLSE